MIQYSVTFRDALKPIPNSFQQLTVDATVGGVRLTVPAMAVAASARLEGAEIRWTVDLTAPTTAVGTLLEIGEVLELVSIAEMANFRAIRTTTTSGLLNTTYFQVARS